MNNSGRTIAKNMGVLMISQFSTWGLSLVIMVFMSRYLGAEGVGQIHLANSIWAIMAILAAFGMDTFLVKEIARDPDRTASYLVVSVIVRLLFSVACFGLVAVYTYFAGYSLLTVQVIFVVGLGNMVGLVTSAIRSALQGLEHFEYISLADIISRFFTAVITIALLLMGYGVVAAVAVGIVANLINLGLQFIPLRRLQSLSFQFQWSSVWMMLNSSFPYLLTLIFLVLYQQVDIVIISLLVNEKTVGWYGGADQLFGTLLFLPNVLIAAVFPALARMHAHGSENLNRLIGKTFDWMLLVAVPIGLGVIVVSNSLVLLLFGADFQNSGPVLAVMGIVLILTYQNILIGQFLISMDRQVKWVWVMAFAALATVPLDLIFVPWCQQQFGNGAIGGALAYVVTETGMFFLGLKFMPAGTLSSKNLWFGVRVMIAGLAMVALTWWLRRQFILIPITFGAFVYLAAIWLLRVVPAEDQALLKNLMLSVWHRLRNSRAQALS